MSQESSWFEQFTWHSERDTEIVILKAVNVKVAQSIKSLVEDYLDSLSFKQEPTDQSTGRMRRGNQQGWVLNLTNKTYRFVSSWECSTAIKNGASTCWPSHIDTHMKKHWPTLTGRKFGL